MRQGNIVSAHRSENDTSNMLQTLSELHLLLMKSLQIVSEIARHYGANPLYGGQRIIL